MNPIITAIIICVMAFLFGLAAMKVWFELTNQTVMRIKDFTAGDRGRLTQRKADYMNEKEARNIFGDAEVDRFLAEGDYDEHQARAYNDPMDDNIGDSPETSGGLARIYPASPRGRDQPVTPARPTPPPPTPGVDTPPVPRDHPQRMYPDEFHNN